MSILYRWISCVWAIFVLFGSGFAGGPGVSTPLPLVEIIGFFILAFINLENKKMLGYAMVAILLYTIYYQTHQFLQSPYLTWNDVKVRTYIPVGILLFSAFSIWKIRPEKDNALDKVVADKKSN